jgi:glycosyltransferase involved in cell wall biosynthesis
MEALFCVCARVTFDRFGVHDVVNDNVVGHIVKVSDNGLAALAFEDCIKRHKEMGEHCIRVASQYGPEKAALKIKELIEKRVYGLL